MFRKAIIAVAIFGAFAWGIAVGFYRAFPYEPLRILKNQVEGDVPPKIRPMATNPYAVTVAAVDQTAGGTADVVMVGDSITAGGRWHEWFPQHRIINRGIGGDIIWGVRQRVPEILSRKPQAIFLMIGINDVLMRNTNDQVLPLYEDVVAKLVGPGRTVYVQSVLDCGGRCDDEQRAQVAPLNAGIAKIAARYGAVFIDLNATMGGARGMPATYSWDGVHLTAKGYAQWRDEITSLMPALVKAIEPA